MIQKPSTRFEISFLCACELKNEIKTLLLKHTRLITIISKISKFKWEHCKVVNTLDIGNGFTIFFQTDSDDNLCLKKN